MLKHKYKAAAAIAALSAMAMNISAAASEAPILVEKLEKGGAIVSVWAMDGCELPELPGIILPGQPDGELPDVNLPDQPETEAPDNG